MSTERHPQKNATDKEVTNRKRPEAKGRTRKGKDILEQIPEGAEAECPKTRKSQPAAYLRTSKFESSFSDCFSGQ